MNRKLSAIAIYIVAMTLGQHTFSAEKEEVGISIQAPELKNQAAEEDAEDLGLYYRGLITGPTKQLAPRRKSKSLSELFFKQRTEKEEKCLTDLGFDNRDLLRYQIDSLETKNIYKCSVQIDHPKFTGKLTRYAPITFARAQLKILACEKLESAKEVSKFEIKCEKLKPSVDVQLLK